MKNYDSPKPQGLGFIGALQIAFIVLKLTNTIKWAWGWVLAPLWGSWLLFGIILILVVLFIKK